MAQVKGNLLLTLAMALLVQPAMLSLAVAEQPAMTPQEPQSSVKDVIPLTMGNIRGHKMLYSEGWYIITSSSRAFDFAREHSLNSSRQALEQVVADAARQSGEYGTSLKNDARDSIRTGTTLVKDGTVLSGEILSATHALGKTQLAYADKGFRKAMESVVRGNIALAKRTEAERQELASLPGKYFQDLKQDFSNIYDLAAQARKRFSRKIEPAWEASFERAGREFRTQYERSGNEQNTLMALGPILAGYLKSLYHGIAKPASKTIVKTTVAGVNYAVFLPVTATAVVAGRTVQAVGLTVFYTGKTGIKIVSPTVEGGILSGLSLLSLGTVPVTYAAGGSIGAINQVAFSTAGPRTWSGCREQGPLQPIPQATSDSLPMMRSRALPRWSSTRLPRASCWAIMHLRRFLPMQSWELWTLQCSLLGTAPGW